MHFICEHDRPRYALLEPQITVLVDVRFRFQGYEKVHDASGAVRIVMQEWICEALAIMGPQPTV
jgi:hypothetical protein